MRAGEVGCEEMCEELTNINSPSWSLNDEEL